MVSGTDVPCPSDAGTLGSLARELRDKLGDEADTFIIPDIAGPICDLGLATQLKPSPMRLSRANQLICHLLVLVDLDADHAATFSTRSLRQMIPSAGQALSIPDEDAAAIGNWVDGADESGGRKTLPMAVRYSDQRLASSARTKKAVLTAISHFVQHKAQG